MAWTSKTIHTYTHIQMDVQSPQKFHNDSTFTSLEIHNLTIGRSEFELRPGEGIDMKISNVSVIFRGTIQYGYGSWL